ncbi:PUR family DNA/RNA-binding protein [Membranicola marinus]|uniref:PUR family DNA/RNA-binding protein n=1 Tax=Membranihabitans marinus TaxID=1227546 RepID=A0A953L816_9BACT|nr:PUR family DNA/RNA-binding protein [Membranihabitans marinus]
MVEKGKSGHLDNVFSQKVNAGKRRTYFFDVKETQGEDFYVTITESTRRSDGNGYNRHKIFLYKEDFNRFQEGLDNAINHIKTELLPDYDYEEFDRKHEEWEKENKDNESHEDGETSTDSFSPDSADEMEW